MISINSDQIFFKNLNFGPLRLFSFFKPKNLGFSKTFSSPDSRALRAVLHEAKKMFPFDVQRYVRFDC